MDNMGTTVREAVILSFYTYLNKIRTLNIPEPRATLDAEQIGFAASKIISSDIFDENMGSGRLRDLLRADREHVETTVLF